MCPTLKLFKECESSQLKLKPDCLYGKNFPSQKVPKNPAFLLRERPLYLFFSLSLIIPYRPLSFLFQFFPIEVDMAISWACFTSSNVSLLQKEFGRIGQKRGILQKYLTFENILCYMCRFYTYTIIHVMLILILIIMYIWGQKLFS